MTSSGCLAGQKVAVTGQLTGPLWGMRRRTAYRLITAAGGTPTSSVTRETTVLVASRTGTIKHRRATALGVPVIDSRQLAAMLGRSPLW